jgi:hypothetical protein
MSSFINMAGTRDLNSDLADCCTRTKLS